MTNSENLYVVYDCPRTDKACSANPIRFSLRQKQLVFVVRCEDCFLEHEVEINISDHEHVIEANIV